MSLPILAPAKSLLCEDKPVEAWIIEENCKQEAGGGHKNLATMTTDGVQCFV